VVYGILTSKYRSTKFYQSFVLAEQNIGYYVLNDFFMPLKEEVNEEEEDKFSTNATTGVRSVEGDETEKDEEESDSEIKQTKEEEEEKEEEEKEEEVKVETKEKENKIKKYAIFVRTPMEVKNEELMAAFKECGDIVEINNKSEEKKYVFVYFKEYNSVEYALKKNNFYIKDTKLSVEKRKFRPFFASKKRFLNKN
jgi:hypothetical protein